MYQSLSKGTTYRFRVRATDKQSAVSSYVYGPSFKPIISDDTSSADRLLGQLADGVVQRVLRRDGSVFDRDGRIGHVHVHRDERRLGRVQGPTRGSASVYVDGVLKATIDLHSTTGVAHAQVYAFNWATSGSHTLKVVVVGTAGHPGSTSTPSSGSPLPDPG